MDSLVENWLYIQCKTIADCRSGLLWLVKPGTHEFIPAAIWPQDSKVCPELIPVARLTAKTGENVLNPSIEGTLLDSAYDHLASPIFINQQLMGIIAFKTKAQSAQKQQQLFAVLEQGKQWLELATVEQRDLLPKEFYPGVVKLIATCLEGNTYQESLIALITELTKQFQCGRVAIGEIKQQQVEIIALSNSAKFDNRANLMRAISDVMDEAVDQDMIIVHPPLTKPHRYVTRAHAALSKQYQAGAICTLPIVYQGIIFAVITLERDAISPFTAEQVRQLEQTMALLSPYLQLKHIVEQPLMVQLTNATKKRFASLFSLHNMGSKLMTAFLLVGLIVTALIKGDFRVHADAILEGKIQRVVASPMDGFILTAAVRAGDIVKQGENMAVMDDRDLRLESSKLASQQQQALREYREARANNDLVNVSVISAKLQQLEAQLKLNSEQLQRAAITAPFDGVVIEGDLSDKLGSPVERGQSLFKIAPLDGYRIVLKVSERLIAYVQVGQEGVLSLSSLPEQRFPLTIQKITTVSKVEDGDNIFRVEASLQQPADLLRPGMVGIAKVSANRKPLLWIWTHELVDWFRLWVWSWWP